jgi:hypothetical protein
MYYVEKWFDLHSYEGVLGVFNARELAQNACDKERFDNHYEGILKIYKVAEFGAKPEFFTIYAPKK